MFRRCGSFLQNYKKGLCTVILQEVKRYKIGSNGSRQISSRILDFTFLEF